MGALANAWEQDLLELKVLSPWRHLEVRNKTHVMTTSWLPGPKFSSKAARSRATKDGTAPWMSDPGSRTVMLIAIFLLVYFAWQIFRWGGVANKHTIGDLAFWPVTVSAIALTWRAARRNHLNVKVRRGWRLISAGLLFYLVGIILQFVYESVLHIRPYPSFADPCYLSFYPLVLSGIMQFPRVSAIRAVRNQRWLDAISLFIAATAVVWFVLLAPASLAPGQSALQVVFSIAYPFGDLVLIFGVTTFIVSRSGSFNGWPLLIFLSSLLVFISADLIYGRLSLENAYAGGDAVDTLWMVALGLLALSASEHTRHSTTEPKVTRVRRKTEDFPLFTYLAAAVSFVLMAANIIGEGLTTDGEILFVGATIVVVFVRLHLSAVARRRLGNYYQSLVERAADYVVVLGADFVPRYVSPPLLRLVGLPLNTVVDETLMQRFVDEGDIALIFAGLERSAASPGVTAQADIRIRDAYGGTRHVTGETTNLLGDPAVEGFVVVLHDITDKVHLEDELRQQAFHDSLTGLPNRALIQDRLIHMLVAAKREGTSVAVLYIDLDDFKDVNDSLGHNAGDELLQAVAARFDAIVRGQDTIGRVGGDEFVLLVEVTGDPETPGLIAQRILDVMAEPFALSSSFGPPLNVGMSVGIAIGDDATSDELLRNADLALYRAKAKGKNCIVEFDQEMYQSVSDRVELENDLKQALSNREFFLVYQPVINLKTLTPFGVEALLRWQHPRRGVVSPLTFISILEERGLIVDAGRWVLHEACEQGARWQNESRLLTISVNASALQLMDPTFIDDISLALAHSHFDPSRLVIEITESTLMREPVKLAAALTEIKQLGVQIAIDDFGTGYSSLSYLRQFPIDVLKIDQSFVADMQRSKEAATVVRTLVHLASELGIETVAEGIEEPEQLAALRDEDCAFGQGYWFAKPMSPAAIGVFLDTWQSEGTVVNTDQLGLPA
jgi:diguanylate cyclase (GGDEF)-like protein/PAS domain S-box-containing protein